MNRDCFGCQRLGVKSKKVIQYAYLFLQCLRNRGEFLLDLTISVNLHLIRVCSSPPTPDQVVGFHNRLQSKGSYSFVSVPDYAECIRSIYLSFFFQERMQQQKRDPICHFCTWQRRKLSSLPFYIIGIKLCCCMKNSDDSFRELLNSASHG